jgi:hypothetical protein
MSDSRTPVDFKIVKQLTFKGFSSSYHITPRVSATQRQGRTAYPIGAARVGVWSDYQNFSHRTLGLASWQHLYNWRRPRGGTRGVAPMTWLGSTAHNVLTLHTLNKSSFDRLRYKLLSGVVVQVATTLRFSPLADRRPALRER